METARVLQAVQRRTHTGLGPAGPTPTGSLPLREWQGSPAALQTSRADPAVDVQGTAEPSGQDQSLREGTSRSKSHPEGSF